MFKKSKTTKQVKVVEEIITQQVVVRVGEFKVKYEQCSTGSTKLVSVRKAFDGTCLMPLKAGESGAYGFNKERLSQLLRLRFVFMREAKMTPSNLKLVDQLHNEIDQYESFLGSYMKLGGRP